MNIYEMVKIVYKDKEVPFANDWQPFILNRFISFSNYICVAAKMNRYIFWLDKPLLEAIYKSVLPRVTPPWVKYVKRPESNITSVMKEYQKIYHWSDQETLEMQPLLEKMEG